MASTACHGAGEAPAPPPPPPRPEALCLNPHPMASSRGASPPGLCCCRRAALPAAAALCQRLPVPEGQGPHGRAAAAATPPGADAAACHCRAWRQAAADARAHTRVVHEPRVWRRCGQPTWHGRSSGWCGSRSQCERIRLAKGGVAMMGWRRTGPDARLPNVCVHSIQGSVLSGVGWGLACPVAGPPHPGVRALSANVSFHT